MKKKSLIIGIIAGLGGFFAFTGIVFSLVVAGLAALGTGVASWFAAKKVGIDD